MVKSLFPLCLAGFFFFCCSFFGISKPPYDFYAHEEAHERIAKQIAQQFNQRFLSSGGGPLVGSEEVLWSYSVMDCRKLTLEQGKRLATDMLRTTLNRAIGNPTYESYMRVTSPDNPNRPSQVCAQYFGFKVGFWDQNVDRPLHPYLAQIRAADSKVYFYYADPHTQALQEPPAEVVSFEDLLRKKDEKDLKDKKDLRPSP